VALAFAAAPAQAVTKTVSFDDLSVGTKVELSFDSRRHGTGELRFGGCRLFFEARR
jgi:hypothetical protein